MNNEILTVFAIFIVFGLLIKVLFDFIFSLVELLRVFFIFVLEEENKIQQEKYGKQ